MDDIQGSEKKILDYWEKDFPALKPLLEATDFVVGYNSIGFDMPIIGNYLGTEVNNLGQLDLMVALYKTLGFRPKLDDVVTATLKRGKTAKGSDAPIFWAKGELDKLRDYCMEDVRLTKELYEYALKNGVLKYKDLSETREIKLDTSKWEEKENTLQKKNNSQQSEKDKCGIIGEIKNDFKKNPENGIIERKKKQG